MERYLVRGLYRKIWPTRSCSILSFPRSYCAPAVTQLPGSGYRNSTLKFHPARTNIVKDRCQSIIKTGDLYQIKGFMMLYLRLCATDFVLTTPQGRVSLADYILSSCRSVGIDSDVETFNRLLEVYLYNNHNFLPSDFLQNMRVKGCSPNLTTFTLLLKAYCNRGSIGSANKLMDFMKASNLPVKEHVYACLITGHARSGNLAAAEAVLTQMEKEEVPVGNHAYGSLLMAYAEKGMISKIEETVKTMCVAGAMCYKKKVVEILASLSANGYGDKMEEVMSLLGTQLDNDNFHSLLYCCLGQGNIEPATLLLQKLSDIGAVDEIMCQSFIGAARKQGLPLTEIVDILENINLNNIYDSLAEVVVREGQPRVEAAWNEFPKKNFLPAMDNFEQWILDSRYILELLGQRRTLHLYYYYPLLARHCSEADVKGMVTTIYQVLRDTNFTDNRTVLQYFNAVLDNAEISKHDFFTSQLSEQCTDEWLKQLLVCQCLCATPTHLAATLNKIADLETVLNESCVLKMLRSFTVLSRDRIKRKETLDIMLILNKCKLTAAIGRRLLWNNGLDIHMLELLALQGVVIPMSDIIDDFITLNNNTNRSTEKMYIKDLWMLIKKSKHVPTPHQLAFIYRSIIRNNGSGFKRTEINSIYQMLPDTQKQDARIRCYRVVDLFNTKMNSDALKEFLDLLSIKDWSLPGYVWSRVLVAAYSWNLEVGDQLYERMKDTKDGDTVLDYTANKNLVKVFIDSYHNLERAEGVLQRMSEQKRSGIGPLYSLVLPYMGEHCLWDKIEEMLVKGAPASAVNQAKVLAFLAENQEDKALELAADKHMNRPFLIRLVRIIVGGISSAEKWREHLVGSGVAENTFDTVLFFTCVDMGLYSKAEQVLKQIQNNMCTDELNLRMRSPEAQTYSRIFQKYNFTPAKPVWQALASKDHPSMRLDSNQLHSELIELDKDDLNDDVMIEDAPEEMQQSVSDEEEPVELQEEGQLSQEEDVLSPPQEAIEQSQSMNDAGQSQTQEELQASS